MIIGLQNLLHGQGLFQYQWFQFDCHALLQFGDFVLQFGGQILEPNGADNGGEEDRVSVDLQKEINVPKRRLPLCHVSITVRTLVTHSFPYLS